MTEAEWEAAVLLRNFAPVARRATLVLKWPPLVKSNSWDWRLSSKVTPVKNQQSCGR